MWARSWMSSTLSPRIRNLQRSSASVSTGDLHGWFIDRWCYSCFICGYVWLYILLYMVRLLMRNLETLQYIPMNFNQQRLINSESELICVFSREAKAAEKNVALVSLMTLLSFDDFKRQLSSYSRNRGLCCCFWQTHYIVVNFSGRVLMFDLLPILMWSSMKFNESPRSSSNICLPNKRFFVLRYSLQTSSQLGKS